MYYAYIELHKATHNTAPDYMYIHTCGFLFNFLCFNIFPILIFLLYRLFNMVLGVHSPDHIHRASLTNSFSANEGVWSFLRLVGICPREMSTIMLGHFTDRCIYMFMYIMTTVCMYCKTMQYMLYMYTCMYTIYEASMSRVCCVFV